jgi:hypothetical protein
MLARTLVLLLLLPTLGCSLPAYFQPKPPHLTAAFPAHVNENIPIGISLPEAEAVLRTSGFQASGKRSLDFATGLMKFPARYVRNDGLVQTRYDVVLYAGEDGVRRVETKQSLGSALDTFLTD